MRKNTQQGISWCNKIPQNKPRPLGLFNECRWVSLSITDCNQAIDREAIDRAAVPAGSPGRRPSARSEFYLVRRCANNRRGAASSSSTRPAIDKHVYLSPAGERTLPSCEGQRRHTFLGERKRDVRARTPTAAPQGFLPPPIVRRLATGGGMVVLYPVIVAVAVIVPCPLN